LAAAAVGKVVADRDAAHRATESSAYVDRTLALLTQAMKQIHSRGDVPPELYQKQFVEVFRPEMMWILGALESTRPASPSLREWHDRLVKNLTRVLRQLEEAVDRFERGDRVDFEYAITRLNDAWSETVESSVLWLKEALGHELD
jgi:hypothetical protein